MIRRLRAASLRIPFRQSFRHAMADRSSTQSVWVEIESVSGAKGWGEGCPRDYVTGETIETALNFIRLIEPEVLLLRTLEQLQAWVGRHAPQIDENPAAWCAVELALLDLLARESAQTVESLLQLPPPEGPFRYSAVLGAESPADFSSQAARYAQLGFTDFKVKLAGDAGDFTRLTLLKASGVPLQSLRFDANNLWRDPEEAVLHLGNLAPFMAIEEPLGRGRYAALEWIAGKTAARIVLDESLLRIEELRHLRLAPHHWIINLRVSKMGGLLRSLALARAAHQAGIPLIIGCQVGETSLLTRAALTVAQTCIGRGLLAQEGAFGTHLLSSDIIPNPLMFGPGGNLEISAFRFDTSPGFGINPVFPDGEGSPFA